MLRNSTRSVFAASNDFPQSSGCLLNSLRAHVSKYISHGFWNYHVLLKPGVSCRGRADIDEENTKTLVHLLLLCRIIFLLILTVIVSAGPPAETVSWWAISSFLTGSIWSLQRGKWWFRLSRLSPDGGLWKSSELSAEYTLKDVKYSPLLCCSSPFFSFNLTISLSLSPDCIRIDCNLSKCLLWLSPLSWLREHALWFHSCCLYALAKTLSFSEA